MTSQRFQARDILGLTPAVDPTVSDSIFALSGKNYRFDSLGPKSSFGNRLLMPMGLSSAEHVQGFRVKLRSGDRCFLMDGNGIWEWNELAGRLDCIYPILRTVSSVYRWSLVYLRNHIYFAHPGVGLLVYTIDSGVCQRHRDIGTGSPDDVISIAENNGRLIAIGPVFFSWSAPSDGLNFSPSLGGGGFQKINERVPGSPICVTSYTRGCLTWTSGGVLRSEFTGDAAVYRHRSLNTEYRPVNSFCTTRVDDDTVVILDERGLFQSRGETLTPYAPLFNEFLIEHNKRHRLADGQNLRLEWDELQRLMYVSVSYTPENPAYEKAFVLYPPLDKWGEFNESHLGILPIQAIGGTRSVDTFGYVDPKGLIRYWLETPSTEADPGIGNALKAANLETIPSSIPLAYAEGNGGYLTSTTIRVNSFEQNPQRPGSGYYADDGFNRMYGQLSGLSAEINIGLFRPTGPSASDESSEVVNVLVRSVLSATQLADTIDYNTTLPDGVDLIPSSGAKQYQYESMNYINHKLTIVSSRDGVTATHKTDPSIVSASPNSRLYACTSVGMWHIANIRAEEPGEAFHIKNLELTAISAGRIL